MIGNKYILAVGFLFLLLTACNQKSATQAEEEKVQALKDVLREGLDKAITVLSDENGFLTNESLAIALPAEAESLIKNIQKLPQGTEMLNSVMSQINQVASSSVEKVAPILYDAIDNISVEDVNRIVKADDAAATAYLEQRIRVPVQKACEPVILNSLDKQLWGEITTRDTWEMLIGNYNKLAGTSVGRIANLQPVDMVLEEFVTEKMLDAIFVLMAREEMNIRKHPATKMSKSAASILGWI